jgi:hypothetical protein
MASFKNDYAFGISNEDTVLEIITKYFNDGVITKAASPYSKYDFKGDKCYYELKSRNCSYNTYPTTIIPASKIMKDNKEYFLFSFTDGLYYIEYDETVFSAFSIGSFVRNQRVDYNDKKSLYYYIPIEKLIKINI